MKPTVGRIVHVYHRGQGPFAAVVTCAGRHPNDETLGFDRICVDVGVPKCNQKVAAGPVEAVPRVDLLEQASFVEDGAVRGPVWCWIWPPKV